MKGQKRSFWARARKDWIRNRSLYFLMLPPILFYILFHYKPMYGVIIAFKDYSPTVGIAKSPWVGLEHFKRFFSSVYFGRLVRNTFLLNVYNLLFGFPAPIILALLLNEVRSRRFKNAVQTITYMPHFISLVVITGIVKDFCVSTGIFNDVVALFGGERTNLLMNPGLYRSLYVGSGIWSGIGWGSIIYLAALAGVDSQLYEAASIDGAGKWKQLIHVTLPSISPTIITMLILRIGQLMSLGYEKTLLLYNSAVYETADIISTYTYRMGLGNQEWSYSAAVGLFNSAINIVLLLAANRISRKYTETSLW